MCYSSINVRSSQSFKCWSGFCLKNLNGIFPHDQNTNLWSIYDIINLWILLLTKTKTYGFYLPQTMILNNNNNDDEKNNKKKNNEKNQKNQRKQLSKNKNNKTFWNLPATQQMMLAMVQVHVSASFITGRISRDMDSTFTVIRINPGSLLVTWMRIPQRAMPD